MGKDNLDKDRFNKYLKFSSLALQMGVGITAFALGGHWLDKKQGNHFPIWTLSLTLLAIFGMLYKLIRDVMRMGKEDEEEMDEKG